MAEAETEVDKIIATINPDKYNEGKTRHGTAEFKKLRDKEGFDKALEKASPNPAQQYSLVYDSPSESLEPVYFWILDFMEQQTDKVEKLVDNFTSSPGSGHFAELGGRATRMQEEAMKILGSVNTVIKSIINIIYDLKQWEIFLSDYKNANSGDKDKAQAGLLSLKQRWMDNVDVKRGNTSIKGLALSQASFVTLIDAFMAADSLKQADELDLNDRVKRILKPRLAEFFEWRKRSEVELKKRYEIEKTYLKSQVSALKLYSRWARPYLRAAEQLRMEGSTKPAAVTAFNTVLFELVLLGTRKISVEDAVFNKHLPREFAKEKLKRDYYSCALVEFDFRGIPQRIGQQPHYTFGGKTDVKFKAYALNSDEIALLKKKMEDSDVGEALKLVEGATTESLDQLKDDIEYYLKSEEEREEEQEKKESEDVNPFAALFGLGRKKKEKPKKTDDKDKDKIEEFEKKGVPKDSYAESVIREYAEEEARELCYNIFDVYKKAHGMPSLGPLEETKANIGELKKFD